MPEYRITLCPPLRELLLLQTHAKLRRAWKRLRSPRRAIPTALIAVLMILYVIQVFIAIAFNESRSPVAIASIAPLGMLGILLMKLLGVCIDREKSGAGFRREETHHLLGGPFPHDQVRLFRVTGHAVSIFFTSVFAAVFFRFHVTSFVAALSGSYLAMLFTYLIYTTIAVAAIHVTLRTYRLVRNVTCGLLVSVLGVGLYRASLQNVSNLEFLHAFASELTKLTHTPVGRVLMYPFVVFTKMITADHFSTWLGWTALGFTFVFLALQLLLRVEVRMTERAWRREQQAFAGATKPFGHKTDDPRLFHDQLLNLARGLPWLAGSGPIVWRQLKAVRRLRGGLGWLLLPLAGSFAVGGYIAYSPEEGAFQTIAVIVVLTSIFLPGLLPFDFRGDLKGLAALKMMPVRPSMVVLGQLVVPVLLLSGFQLVALSTLLLHDPRILPTILLTMLFLIPTNTIILALENLIFLLYPYRIAEFDMQATVRRLVMLMTKFCVLFLAVLLALLVGFGVLALRIGTAGVPWIGESLVSVHKPLLVVLQLVTLSAVAAGATTATCWAYRRFDLGEDLPI